MRRCCLESGVHGDEAACFTNVEKALFIQTVIECRKSGNRAPFADEQAPLVEKKDERMNERCKLHPSSVCLEYDHGQSLDRVVDMMRAGWLKPLMPGGDS